MRLSDRTVQEHLRRDPRLNNKQKQMLSECLKSDPEAEIFGLDSKMRPVIRVRSGIPREPRVWTVMRNGDPGDVSWNEGYEEHYPYTYAGPIDLAAIAEPWTEKTRR